MKLKLREYALNKWLFTEQQQQQQHNMSVHIDFTNLKQYNSSLNNSLVL